MVKKKVNIEFYLFLILIFGSFLLRFIYSAFYGDESLAGEWRVLVNNLENYKIYSFFVFDNQPIPTVYMPPLYAYFLYIIKIISLNKINFISLVIFLQVILSTYSIYIFYLINKNFFLEKLCLINSFIFTLIPLNIYASSKISSITLQIFLSLVFLHLLFLIIKNPKNKYIFLFSVFSGLLILTRGEFFLILIAIILLAIYKKNIKINNLIKIILIIFITVSPYLIRNYNTFNEIVIVKSLGYNLWKGNNEYSPVEGYENYKSPKLYNFKIELDKLKKNKNYEISRDNFFLDKAKTNLIKDPSRYIGLFFKKLFSFYFIDLNSSYKNYYHYLHFFPILLISILSVPGFLILLKKNKYRINYLELYLLSNLFLFSVFFILPRYKLIIIPIQIIFVGFLIQYLFNKFYKRKLKDE